MSQHAPEGWRTVTPRIVVHGAEKFVAFVTRVFGATGEYDDARPAEVRLGDSIIMITEAGVRAPMPAFLYVYVEDADAVYQRALAAGATAIEAPADMPYGDRRGMVEDGWGNTWQIATRITLPPATRRPASRVRKVPRFDTKALYRALDGQRKAREQSWKDVAASIGVSAATIMRTRTGGRMEVDGMLAMVAWLGVPVETFVRSG